MQTFADAVNTFRFTIMGGGNRWSKVEETILLYFNSRGVQHEACAALITLKCNRIRSMLGIRHRLEDLRKHNPSLWDVNAQNWNLDAVNMWLLDQNIPNLQSFLSFGREEETIVERVSFMHRYLMSCTCLQYLVSEFHTGQGSASCAISSLQRSGWAVSHFNAINFALFSVGLRDECWVETSDSFNLVVALNLYVWLH